MSFREMRSFTEMMRALGYPRIISLDNFRKPNFPLVSEILQWLVKQYNPEAEIPTETDTEADRVIFVKSCAQFMALKAHIALNTKNLYQADGYAVRELIKITRVLYAAIREAERNLEIQQKNILNIQFNFNANLNNVEDEEFAADAVIASIQSQSGDLQVSRKLASEITTAGANLSDHLAKEPELRQLRGLALNRPLQVGDLESGVVASKDAVQQEIQKSDAKLTNLSSDKKNLEDRVAKKKGELERNQKRLETLQAVRPPWMDDFKRTEVEVVRLYKEYLERFRNVAYLEHRIRLLNESEQEKLNEQMSHHLRDRVGHHSRHGIGNDKNDKNGRNDKKDRNDKSGAARVKEGSQELQQVQESGSHHSHSDREARSRRHGTHRSVSREINAQTSNTSVGRQSRTRQPQQQQPQQQSTQRLEASRESQKRPAAKRSGTKQHQRQQRKQQQPQQQQLTPQSQHQLSPDMRRNLSRAQQRGSAASSNSKPSIVRATSSRGTTGNSNAGNVNQDERRDDRGRRDYGNFSTNANDNVNNNEAQKCVRNGDNDNDDQNDIAVEFSSLEDSVALGDFVVEARPKSLKGRRNRRRTRGRPKRESGNGSGGGRRGGGGNGSRGGNGSGSGGTTSQSQEIADDDTGSDLTSTGQKEATATEEGKSSKEKRKRDKKKRRKDKNRKQREADRDSEERVVRGEQEEEEEADPEPSSAARRGFAALVDKLSLKAKVKKNSNQNSGVKTTTATTANAVKKTPKMSGNESSLDGASAAYCGASAATAAIGGNERKNWRRLDLDRNLVNASTMALRNYSMKDDDDDDDDVINDDDDEDDDIDFDYETDDEYFADATTERQHINLEEEEADDVDIRSLEKDFDEVMALAQCPIGRGRLGEGVGVGVIEGGGGGETREGRGGRGRDYNVFFKALHSTRPKSAYKKTFDELVSFEKMECDEEGRGRGREGGRGEAGEESTDEIVEALLRRPTSPVKKGHDPSNQPMQRPTSPVKRMISRNLENKGQFGTMGIGSDDSDDDDEIDDVDDDEDDDEEEEDDVDADSEDLDIELNRMAFGESDSPSTSSEQNF